MIDDDEHRAHMSDEDATRRRHDRFGELPARMRPEDWLEETDTDPPAHEVERSSQIVQTPGAPYET